MVGHGCDKLDHLFNGVLLYVLPLQVSSHQNKVLWRAIAKDVWTLGVYGRWSTHCRKRWDDLRRWARKTVEAQLGMATQQGRGACRTLTTLMARIMAVAYPELDGCLRASQQPQWGAEAPAIEGAASHRTLEAESTDAEGASGTEGEGSTKAETGGDNTDPDTSSNGSSLMVADTSVTTPAASTAATHRMWRTPL
ncbi:hypothetical protein NDU88_005321 [Pleurodeles waltl]|uniref:Myb/SANT-like DNA-binding domain-containing protein n=1 Tax=Pleurodeles waltl TaxID=8319 RepID=A0AAV7LP82_PLEWA|nr:hypothetical protein NDU88_005321 [Pleurodeles waltl]